MQQNIDELEHQRATIKTMVQLREWIVADLAITQRYHVSLVTPQERTALATNAKPSSDLKRGPLQPGEGIQTLLRAISADADDALLAPESMLAEAKRHELTPQLYFHFRSWVPSRSPFKGTRRRSVASS